MSNEAFPSPAPWQVHSFTKEELQELRTIVEARLGIHIGPEKDYLLSSRFGKMLNFNGMSSGTELIDNLKRMPLEAEKALASFLTTGHTFFFREPEHLGILVYLIGHYKIKSPRIWCAASSTGEEVYSIIISLLEAHILDFTMVASDINLDVLKACRSGYYREERLREVPSPLLQRYFQPGTQAGTHRINPALSDRVILKRLNLTESFRFESQFDIIFCRNVLIYFTPATQLRVLANLANNLTPGGYLFLGHSEPLMSAVPHLLPIAPAVYQKKP